MEIDQNMKWCNVSNRNLYKCYTASPYFVCLLRPTVSSVLSMSVCRSVVYDLTPVRSPPMSTMEAIDVVVVDCCCCCKQIIIMSAILRIVYPPFVSTVLLLQWSSLLIWCDGGWMVSPDCGLLLATALSLFSMRIGKRFFLSEGHT